MRHCRTYLPVLPGLRVQDLEIPWAAAVGQAVLPEPPEGFGCRSAAEVADTVQAGEAEAAEVDEQVLHGEDAQLPARPDNPFLLLPRKASSVFSLSTLSG